MEGVSEDARSPAAWLVLALIIEQPSHGYEIHRRYEQRFGGFLPTSRPRLYAILEQLRSSRMVESIVLESGDGSRKQHDLRRSCRATKAGAQAYRRWVSERMRDDPEQLELLGRIASAGLLGVDTVSDLIDRYESDCMREMKALPTSEAGAAHDNVTELVESLVVDQRRREMRARIDWVIYARRIVKNFVERLGVAGVQEP